MGGVCSRSAITDSVSLKVDAPVEVLWETIGDTEAYASFLSHVKWIKCHQDSGDVKVGTRYQETREYVGFSFTVNITVTEVGTDPLHICLGGSFAKGPHIHNVEYSMTMMLFPVDEISCEVLGTFGFQPGGMRGWLKQATCHGCLVREGHQVLQAELEDYATEAVRRYEERKGQVQ